MADSAGDVLEEADVTESEWLTSEDPAAMLRYLDPEGQPPVLYRHMVERKPRSTLLSQRKFRLWICACARQVWHLLKDHAPCPDCQIPGKVVFYGKCKTCGGTGSINRPRHAVEVAERFAEGGVLLEELNRWEKIADRALLDQWYADGEPIISRETRPSPVWSARCWAKFAIYSDTDVYFAVNYHVLDPIVTPATQANLLRDICGNPFRPMALPREECGEVCDRCKWTGMEIREGCDAFQVVIDWANRKKNCSNCGGSGRKRICPWLTPAVLAIARTAYEERGRVCGRCDGTGKARYADLEDEEPDCDCSDCQGTGRAGDGTLDPDNLAILADALQDAGCDNDDMLGHLRGKECIHPMLDEEKRRRLVAANRRVLCSAGCCFECEECSAKPGSPRLCKSCLELRALCNSLGGRPKWIALRCPHVRGCWVIDLLRGVT